MIVYTTVYVQCALYSTQCVGCRVVDCSICQSLLEKVDSAVESILCTFYRTNARVFFL